MRIALRESGSSKVPGRGEYELAGRQRDIRSPELAERSIVFQVSPAIRVPGHSEMRIAQGKPRIRLFNPREDTHAYLLMSAILLLPRPKRELRQTGRASRVLTGGGYSVVGIDVDVLRQDGQEVLLRPKRLHAGNTSGRRTRVETAPRMGAIHRLWIAAEEVDSDLGNLVRLHRHAVQDRPEDHRGLQRIAEEIRALAGQEGDPLVFLTDRLKGQGLPEETELGSLVFGQNEVELGSEEDDASALESAKEQVQRWRTTIARGPAARRFSNAVKSAYDHRCLFTGKRLPPTDETPTSGVDSAHILPWAEHQIDHVANGVCLDKLCHWAFDAGILRLDWVEARYVLTIPPAVKKAAEAVGFDLDAFSGLVGALPQSRLPEDKRYWPRPDFLSKLNAEMFG